MTEVIEHMVKIKILDREFTIRSNEEEKIRDVADYLNRQLELTKEGSPVLNKVDLFTMTAFRISSELFQVREELEATRQEIEHQAEALAAKIDRNLDKLAVLNRRTGG